MVSTRPWLLGAIALAIGCGRIGYDDVGGDAEGLELIDAGLLDGGDVMDSTPSTQCPPVCSGGCPAGVCVIRDVTAAVTCPAGMPCEVVCDLDNSCAHPISCGDAIGCRVRCTGSHSCNRGIACGTAACELICSGDRACTNIYCESSTFCKASCGGFNSCNFATECGTGPCNFLCEGTGSCANGVRCADSCGCDATCPSEGCPTMPREYQCPSGCSNPDGSCSSSLDGCATCP